MKKTLTLFLMGGNITINGDFVEIRGEVSIETGTELTIDTN